MHKGKWIGKEGSSSYNRLFKGGHNEGIQVFNKLIKNGKIIQ